jgi:hypothetical protein
MNASILKGTTWQHATASTIISNTIAFSVIKSPISNCAQDAFLNCAFESSVFFPLYIPISEICGIYVLNCIVACIEFSYKIHVLKPCISFDD